MRYIDKSPKHLRLLYVELIALGALMLLSGCNKPVHEAQLPTESTPITTPTDLDAIPNSTPFTPTTVTPIPKLLHSTATIPPKCELPPIAPVTKDNLQDTVNALSPIICKEITGGCSTPITAKTSNAQTSPCDVGSGFIGTACAVTDNTGKETIVVWDQSFKNLKPIDQRDSLFEEIIHTQAARGKYTFLSEKGQILVDINGLKVNITDIYHDSVMFGFTLNEVVANGYVGEIIAKSGSCPVSLDKALYNQMRGDLISYLNQIDMSFDEFVQFSLGKGGVDHNQTVVDLAILLGSKIEGVDPPTDLNNPDTYRIFTEGINALAVLQQGVIDNLSFESLNHWEDIVQKIHSHKKSSDSRIHEPHFTLNYHISPNMLKVITQGKHTLQIRNSRQDVRGKGRFRERISLV